MFFNLFLAIVNSYNSTLVLDLMNSHSISLLDALHFIMDMESI